MKTNFQDDVYRMLNSHPDLPGGYDTLKAASALEASAVVAQISQLCADACINEVMSENLRDCITICTNQATWAKLTAGLLSNPSSYELEALTLALTGTIKASEECAEECSRHASMHAHCALCAEASRHAADACKDLLRSLNG